MPGKPGRKARARTSLGVQLSGHDGEIPKLLDITERRDRCDWRGAGHMCELLKASGGEARGWCEGGQFRDGEDDGKGRTWRSFLSMGRNGERSWRY